MTQRIFLPLSLTAMLASLPAAASPSRQDQAGVRESEPPRQIELVRVPTPLPLPGQLKPLAPPLARERADPRARIGDANAAARMQPSRESFLNAIQQYPWTEGALYQLYAAPGQVTDVALQPGEKLVGPGPVAAGDTVRWIIGDTTSGVGGEERVHILVKPTRADLATNLVINTDRRTYHLELRSTASTYMASVSWTYPLDAITALRARNQAEAVALPIAGDIDLTALSFRYRLDGDRPEWRPRTIFDDGRQVFIEFPVTVSQSDMPPLFVVGGQGQAELVNYRVRGRYMIVDRLFDVAELRLGSGKSQKHVRIIRDDKRLREKVK